MFYIAFMYLNYLAVSLMEHAGGERCEGFIIFIQSL